MVKEVRYKEKTSLIIAIYFIPLHYGTNDRNMENLLTKWSNSIVYGRTMIQIGIHNKINFRP